MQGSLKTDERKACALVISKYRPFFLRFQAAFGTWNTRAVKPAPPPTPPPTKGSLKRQTVKRVGINAHPTTRRHALGNWVGNQSVCCPTVGWVLAAHAFFVPRQPETANGKTRGHKCPPYQTAARAGELGGQSIRVLLSRRVGTCCPRVPCPKAA